MVKIVPLSEIRTNMIAPRDACGEVSVAVVQSDATMIPVCMNCLRDLKENLDEYLSQHEQPKIKRIS